MKRLLGICVFVVIILIIGIFYPRTTIAPSILINNTFVQVRVAQTSTEVTKGLGGTPSLEENEGMLFIFPQKDITPTFWMKDMLIDLDMIWINDNKIVDIHHNVPAQTGAPDNELQLYSPKQAIDYVLEVNAGFSQKNTIQIGDNVDLSSVTNN